MDFGAIRQQNINANKKLLESLGFEKPAQLPRTAKKNASAKSKKRKANNTEKENVERPKKVAKIASEQQPQAVDDNSGRRRSQRIAAAKPKPQLDLHNNSDKGEDGSESEYENQDQTRKTNTRYKVIVRSANAEHVGNRLGQRKHDPKTFGAIPGIEVGSWWETRAECSTDAIHAPFVAGIAGSAQDGAYSVALSGGYEDDVDLGYAFTYTGSGGRNLKGTKDKPKNLRTAPQSSHQTFDNAMNASLKVIPTPSTPDTLHANLSVIKRSVETKRPVRVVRGYKLHSEFAPSHGYRYDGLYTVEKAWLERGLNAHGYKVCKFAFKRLPGQPPLRTKEDVDDGASENQDDDNKSSAEGEVTDGKDVPSDADDDSTEEPNGEEEQTSDDADDHDD